MFAVPVIVVQTMELPVHENFSACLMVIELSVPIHTAPLSVPGIKIPSPVSPVTEAANVSAVGLLAAFLAYPGHFAADVADSVGVPIVVLPPDSQLIVPPPVKVVAGIDTELPPVLPPIHPLTVMVLVVFPDSAVHVILPVLAL